jgi:Domain of unknown function (DUF4432)
VLSVKETVENGSSEPVEVMWVHHPGFGAPFVDARCRLDTGATTLIGDADAPGTVLPRDYVGPLPEAFRFAPGGPRAVFGALTDFTAPWFALTSQTHGFGIAMAWDPDIFPHAWFWQECHASSGFPWNREAYVVAVEPANALPGEGTVDSFERGVAPILAPGQSLRSDVVLSAFRAAGRVTAVNRDGTVHTEPV